MRFPISALFKPVDGVGFVDFVSACVPLLSALGLSGSMSHGGKKPVSSQNIVP